jgi:Interferon-induced transmembrane protein
VNEPVQRRGVWWHQQADGTWLRWDEGSGTWERSDTPPPPPEGSDLPPAPPMPAGGPAYAGTGDVPDYLVWAILVTIFCFLPTGIAAIVFASQVKSKLAAGDRAGAIDASNKARTWTIVSVVVGLAFGIILAIALSTASVTHIDINYP